MKLRLRVRSYRGVQTWLGEHGPRVFWIGPVREFALAAIVEEWLERNYPEECARWRQLREAA